MDSQLPSFDTMDLSEARVAYEMALATLEEALPEQTQPTIVVDPDTVAWPRLLLKVVVLFPVAMARGFWNLLRAIWGELEELFGNIKNSLLRFSNDEEVILGGPAIERRESIRKLLLDVLWARDHVQDSIEKEDGATYQSKREVLAYVMANERRLQRLGQRALATADLVTSDLRDSQPKPPDHSRWWWYLNYPRARRARRVNTLWFILAFAPALVSIVLITLLAQRLAINGPDLLSGASVVAQVGLGLGSILAGRELLNDLIRQGVSGGWQGQITFMLASLFLIVIVAFYFLAPPAAAFVYNVFGQRAMDGGNAAEAELYLESAARLDPDPYAANFLEVGCLYETLGSPDRAQDVYERVLEADSRLLLARYHLANLYSDQGDYPKALQLLEDGLNLLAVAEEDMAADEEDFLPNINEPQEILQMEYLLRLARGRAYLGNDAPQQAEANLTEAETLFEEIVLYESQYPTVTNTTDPLDMMRCSPDDEIRPFVLDTKMNLHYYLALTYDSVCDENTTDLALDEWQVVRGQSSNNSRQDTWRDEAIRRLTAARQGDTCANNYGQIDVPPNPLIPPPQPVGDTEGDSSPALEDAG
ncbi:MAG: tetratricopeptide repeat protein [Chloroflexi bacterium]|nr:tetratricopeptide repeat protein [Chloroflexota bacterium]